MEKSKIISDDDKVKSAYALNLCTVSVSQIVDYDDLNVLEQEYDAILNNLNLEKIIKDDSLLNILKQILDTITYFKMEDIEKKIIEKEYQQQMKNAIWSAVPNFGLIVAGGNPLTMAISLASQVGIGYMNYRKNKNQNAWDKEKKMLRLQQSAMEQLNGLRRELFTTAWNLAEKYEFPDEYRLTEKQIEQYNNILTDADPIRKFERLSFIKDNFEAYPPFWYFYGSTANYIANAKNLEDTESHIFALNDSTRKKFKDEAIKAFEKYNELNKFNILREDQITASFALEYADILLDSENPDKTKIKELIELAVKMAPNSYDILELCSIAYLRIEESLSAAKLLKFLVNENYNKIINAQILSSIYVKEKNKEEYDILKTRVGTQYLFPMPGEDESLEETQEKFISQQRDILCKKYACIIDELVEKYSIQWNKIHSIFDYSVEYDNSFFMDTQNGKYERFSAASKVFSQIETKASYVDRLRNQNTYLCMINVLNDSINGLFSLPAVNDYSIQENIINNIKKEISDNKDFLNELIEKTNGDLFDLDDYKQLSDFSLNNIYKQSISDLKSCCEKYVECIDSKYLSNEEGKLRYICIKENIKEPEIILEIKTLSESTENSLPFTPEIFGAIAIENQRKVEKIDKIVKFTRNFVNKIILKNKSTKILIKGDIDFEKYFYKSIFNGHANIKKESIAIINDTNKSGFDLILTTEGLLSVKKGKIGVLTPFNEVKLTDAGDSLILYSGNIFIEGDKYKNSEIDSINIYNLIKDIYGMLEDDVSNKLEYIDQLNSENIAEWFNKQTKNMDKNDMLMSLLYYSPENMSRFGLCTSEKNSFENKLIQVIYESKSEFVLNYRIIEYKTIDTKLQAYLDENQETKIKIQ